MPANPRTFAAYRALARALARLAPFYRDRAIAALAKALADGRSSTASELRPLLSDEELARACAMAVRIQRARDATAFDLAVLRLKTAVVSCARSCRRVPRRSVANGRSTNR
jgi:hypothetical protein